MTMSDSLEQEPLTRLNIVTNNSSSEDASGKLTVLAEANPISLSRMDSNTSSHIKSDTATDVRKVSVAKSNGDESGDDVDFEVTLPKGEERGDETHDNPDEASVPLGAGGKKKRKKKPKSQRGLVRFHLQLWKACANAFLVHRKIQPDSRSTTSILPSRQPNLRKNGAYMTCEWV